MFWGIVDMFWGIVDIFWGIVDTKKKSEIWGIPEKSGKKLMLTNKKTTNKICSPLFLFLRKKRKKRKIKKSRKYFGK
jgi:hypothetical protein